VPIIEDPGRPGLASLKMGLARVTQRSALQVIYQRLLGAGEDLAGGCEQLIAAGHGWAQDLSRNVRQDLAVQPEISHDTQPGALALGEPVPCKLELAYIIAPRVHGLDREPYPGMGESLCGQQPQEIFDIVLIVNVHIGSYPEGHAGG